MKKLLLIVVSVFFICLFSACNNSKPVDYPNVTDFEAALNNGEDLTGKTVTFTVDKFVPDSLFGYNLQAGEHLNFCSSDHPGCKAGDTITVEVVSVKSFTGSYIISYKIIK